MAVFIETVEKKRSRCIEPRNGDVLWRDVRSEMALSARDKNNLANIIVTISLHPWVQKFPSHSTEILTDKW